MRTAPSVEEHVYPGPTRWIGEGLLPGDAIQFRPSPPPQAREVASTSRYQPCPKCGGVSSYDTRAVDEERIPDPHCVACGYRPTRTLEEIEPDDPFGLQETKQRKRRPRNGKIAL